MTTDETEPLDWPRMTRSRRNRHTPTLTHQIMLFEVFHDRVESEYTDVECCFEGLECEVGKGADVE